MKISKINNHKMTLTIGLYIFFTLIFTILFALSQTKVGLSFKKISLPQLGPAIAVLLLFVIFKELPARINFQLEKHIITKIVIAFLLPICLFTIGFLIAKLLHLNVKINENLATLLPLMITGMLIGAIGEEIGWRSFLQPFLEKNTSILLASILVGTIWGLWHIAHYKNGVFYMLGFLMFTLSASIIIAWLLRGTDYNLWLSVFFHFSINICFLIFFHHSLKDTKYMLINGLVWLIPAIIIVFSKGTDWIKA